MSQYDVIVVGAGTAGLFCANFLARYGKKTLLLEHNHQPGGLTGGFWRRKFYFDAGDQSFESGGIMIPLLKNLGLYRPGDWEFADYTIAYERGSVVMKDQRKALTELLDLFPEQRQELSQLYSEMIRCANVMGSISNDRTSPIDKSGFARLRSIIDLGRTFVSNRAMMKEMMSTSIPDLYKRHLPPSEFRDRMTQVGYRNMPVGMGAGFWFTWFEDYWYYKRGLQALMNDLAASFVRQGGVMHCNQTVDRILIENNRATGVRTKDGNAYDGKSVVFAGTLQRLCTELIQADLLDPGLVNRIKTAPLSEPLVALYLGVDMSDKELSRYLKTHHTLFFPEGPVPDYDDWKNERMHETAFTEINWTSMRCKELAPLNKNSLVLQTFTSYNWMDKWGTGGDDFKRPRKYKDLKSMVAAQMLETACRYIPELKDRIVYQTLGSPLSTIRFTLNPEGASCGWSLALGQSYLQGKWLSLTTPIDRLYSIGHTTFWPGGVPMAALSGVIVANMIKHEGKIDLWKGAVRLLRSRSPRPK
jgi:phytoene dehydrogenase-like protein